MSPSPMAEYLCQDSVVEEPEDSLQASYLTVLRRAAVHILPLSISFTTAGDKKNSREDRLIAEGTECTQQIKRDL